MRTFQLRPLDVGQLLDESFQVFRAGFAPFLGFQAIVYVPGAALMALGLSWFGDELLRLVETGEVPDPLRLGLVVGAGLFLLMLLQTLLTSLSTVALTRGIADTYLGRPWSFGTLLLRALSVVPRAFAAAGAYAGLLVVALGLPAAIVLLAAVQLVIPAVQAGQILRVVLLGFAGLALGLVSLSAAIYLMVRYSLAFTALSLEPCTVLDAFRRSAELVRGRYLYATGLLLILVMIGALLGGALSAFIPSPSFEGLDADALKTLLPSVIRGQILSMVLGQLVGMVTNCYAVIAWTLFYFSRRCEREGFDLEHLARSAAPDAG